MQYRVAHSGSATTVSIGISAIPSRFTSFSASRLLARKVVHKRLEKHTNDSRRQVLRIS